MAAHSRVQSHPTAPKLRAAFEIDPTQPIPQPALGYAGSFVLQDEGSPPSGPGTIWTVVLYLVGGSTVTLDPGDADCVVIDVPAVLVDANGNATPGGVVTPLSALATAIDNGGDDRGDPPAIVPS